MRSASFVAVVAEEAGESYWNEIDPEALLERLIAVVATPKEEPTND